MQIVQQIYMPTNRWKTTTSFFIRFEEPSSSWVLQPMSGLAIGEITMLTQGFIIPFVRFEFEGLADNARDFLHPLQKCDALSLSRNG